MKRLSLLLLCAAIGAGLLLAPQGRAQSAHDTSAHDSWLRGRSVLTVAVAPQQLANPDFSAQSLAASLPRMHPAHIRADWCNDQERQRGVVVLDNHDVVFWHSCATDLIVFEGDAYPGSFSIVNRSSRPDMES